MAEGYRGLLAPWIGGAAKPGAVGQGYRGLLAFWAGGAANYGTAPLAAPHRRPSGVFLFGQMGRRDPRY